MKPYQDKDTLQKIYNEEGSILKTAIRLKVNEKTIAVWMKKFDIKNKGTKGAKKHFFNENIFEEIDSEEKAYWFGFIMADGCIYSNKESKRLQINLSSKDINHLNKFQIFLNSDYKIQTKVIKNTEASLLKINSTKLCKDLINKGILERKSLINKYPKNVIPDKYFLDFLRGYFDGDGCLSKNKKSSIKILGTKEFLESIQFILLNNFQIETSLYKNKNIFSLEILRNECKKDFLNLIYINANIYLERKYDLYVHFKSNLIDKI